VNESRGRFGRHKVNSRTLEPRTLDCKFKIVQRPK
jgi:hypothetical protein